MRAIRTTVMKENHAIGHLAMFGANLLWGIMSPISKAVLESGAITPLALTTFRMLGASVLFWIASAFARKEHVPPHDLAMLFFASLFGITLNQGCFIAGVSLTSPIDASVITTTVPIITMIIAAFHLKEPVTNKKVIGIFLGALGALILILNGQQPNAGMAKESSMAGNILCLTGEICFAIYYVVFKSLVSRYSPITLMKWMFTYATICCVPFSYSDMVSVDIPHLSSVLLYELTFIIAGATFLSYLLIPIGQKRLRPTVVSMYNYLQPIVAAMLAILWGMDRFTPTKGLAIVLVFLGVYVVNKSKSRAQMEAEAVALAAQQAAAENRKENRHSVSDRKA